MKRLMIICTGIWLITSIINAYTFHNFDEAKEGRSLSCTVLQNDDLSYKVRINLHGVNITEMKHAGISFNALMFEYFYTLNNIGEPALPTVPQLIAIPDGFYVKGMNIRELHWDSMSVGKVYPFQPSYREGEKPKEFFYSESAYESPIYQSPLIVNKRIKEWKGDKFLYVNICPFKYYPTSGTASVLTEYEIDVEFMPSEKESASKDQSGNPDKTSRKFINPNEPNDLLIIAHNSFSPLTNPDIKKFCFWKACKGIRTRVVSTSLTGDHPSSINTYISDSIAGGNFKNILLIGNSSQIPTCEETIWVPGNNGTPEPNIIKSDYLYGEQGTYDHINIGRFCVTTDDGLSNMVEKTIEYESTSLGASSNKALLMAQAYNNDFLNCSETISEGQYDNPFTFSKAYGGQGATNSDVFSLVNSGLNIVNYRGHGSEYRYETWNTENEDFTYGVYCDSVSANAPNPIFFSIACLSGNIDSSGACLLESFMNKRRRGSTAYMGSTTESFHQQNNRLDVWLFQILLNDSARHLGRINSLAQELTIKNSDDSADSLKSIVNAYSYLLGGDPTLEVWTAPAQEFNDSLLFVFDDVLYTGAENEFYNINIISLEGELLQTIPITSWYTSLPVTSPCYISLTKHNYIPRVYYYDPVSNYIQNKTFTENALYANGPLAIGSSVTNSIPQGEVVVKSGNTLKIYNKAGVTIPSGFKCEKGATFIVTSVMKQ